MKTIVNLALLSAMLITNVCFVYSQVPNIYMSATKLGETAIYEIYHFQVSTSSQVDEIELTGISLCKNASSCSDYKYITKGCTSTSVMLNCKVKEGNSTLYDGCVVVISPKAGCFGGG